MSNTYRIDRNLSSATVPCGMNSLLYCGDSLQAATKAFEAASPGLSPWGEPCTAYGVTLAIWNGADYVVKRSKGFGRHLYPTS